MRLERFSQQPAVSARLHQSGQQLRVGRYARALDQSDHRALGVAAIDVHVRGEVVRERQLGIEIERALQRLVGFLLPAPSPLGAAPFREHAAHAREPRPRGRVARVFGQALLVHLAREAP